MSAYGTTQCKWDIIIPFSLLWKNYKRIIKDNKAIALTANQPFIDEDRIYTHRYPKNIINISNADQRNKKCHPTQKPVKLFEYLIKTYTNEGDIVLDNCAGSGTTAIACMNTNRKYILIEKIRNI